MSTLSLTTNTVSANTHNGAAEGWQLACEDDLLNMQEAEVAGSWGVPFGLAVSGIPALPLLRLHDPHRKERRTSQLRRRWTGNRGFGAGVRRVVCPVGYLEPSIRSNMEQASVFVLNLHSSGIGGIRARQRRRVSCTHQKSGHCQLLLYVSVGILCHSLGG
jgi:hypothetical protein